MGSCLSFQRVRRYIFLSFPIYISLIRTFLLDLPPTCFVMFYMGIDDGGIDTKWLRYKTVWFDLFVDFCPAGSANAPTCSCVKAMANSVATMRE